MWFIDVVVFILWFVEIIIWFKEECFKLGVFVSVIGYVGDGNFYVVMMYDLRNVG